MSLLQQRMAERAAERKAAQPTKLVDPVAARVVAEPKELNLPAAAAVIIDSMQELADAPITAPAPTAFKLKPTAKLAGLTEISTTITEALTEADQKVADQEAKGVYKLPEEAHTLMGEEANHLIATMQALDAALVEKTPEIRTLSSAIRKNLEQYPELTHILNDDQLHIMVQGYLTIANVKTAPKTKAAKTAAANKKADSNIKSLASKSIDELF